jgi:methanogenic corrinoid protein MtbC1
MTRASSQSPEDLTAQAASVARAAADTLLEQHPAMRERFGANALQVWTDHLCQQIVELSAALAAGKPELFASRVAWLRTTMAARDVPVTDLDISLESLRGTLGSLLEANLRSAALDCIDRARAALDGTAAEVQSSTLDPGLATDRVAIRYVQAIVAGNALAGMEIVMDAVREGLRLRDAILKVLLPAQREAGHLWHLNRISIAEEHMVTSTTQRLMAVLASYAEHIPDRGRTVVAAAVAGNTHDIGIRAISYLLEFEGWRTIYLGPDVPRREFPEAVKCFDADIVMLSLALTTQLPALRRTIDAIRERCGDSVKILVGGTGLADAPDLWREVGADGYAADAESTLNLAEELVPLQ